MKNYEINSDGLIRQINYNKKVYDEHYIDRSYNTYGELNNYMSYMRLGFIVGSLNGKFPQSILDVGYGNGAFLKACSNIIPNCFGYDINNIKLPNNIHTVDNIFDKHYDVITFFDSLEHFEDVYFINRLQCNYICVSVPWCHNFNDAWLEKWKHLKPDEHLWHFNDVSLVKFMKNQGFDIVNLGNVEDLIRKSNYSYPNILTAVFKNHNI